MIVHVELVSCPPVESLTPVLGTQGKDLRLGESIPILPRQHAASKRPSDTCHRQTATMRLVSRIERRERYPNLEQKGTSNRGHDLRSIEPCPIADVPPLGGFADTPGYLQDAGSGIVGFHLWYRSVSHWVLLLPFDVVIRPCCSQPRHLGAREPFARPASCPAC